MPKPTFRPSLAPLWGIATAGLLLVVALLLSPFPPALQVALAAVVVLGSGFAVGALYDDDEPAEPEVPVDPPASP